MSKMYGLDGIAQSTELGKGGARVKDNSGVIEARNNADSALAIMRSADAVGTSDVLNKGQGDTLYGRTVTERSASFTYETSSPFNIGATLETGDRVIAAFLHVGTIFDGTTPTLEIGISGNTDAVMTTSETDLTKADDGMSFRRHEASGSDQMIGTLDAGAGASAGAGEILLLIAKAP